MNSTRESVRNRPQSAKGRRRPSPTSLPSSPSNHQLSSDRIHTAPSQVTTETQPELASESISKPLVRGLSHDSVLPDYPQPPQSTSTSLSKYKRLPSIGNRNPIDTKKVSPAFQPRPPNSVISSSTFKRNHLARRASDPVRKLYQVFATYVVYYSSGN